jgi:F-type H+-transporting ATPase subunit delta
VTLNEGQIEALKEALSKKLDKQVDIEAKVDPAVIGGISVYVDGFLIDHTLTKRFQDLKKQLHCF